MHICFPLSVSPMREILFSSLFFCPPKIFHRTPTIQSQKNELFLHCTGDVTCQQWNQYFPNVDEFASSLVYALCSPQCLVINRKYRILRVTVTSASFTNACLCWLSEFCAKQYHCGQQGELHRQCYTSPFPSVMPKSEF